MDYKDNRETDKIESLQRRSRSSANYSKSGVLVIDRERFIILLAMIAFALVLVSVVLVTAITGGGNDNKNQGGALNNDAHVHDLKMSMELVEGKFNLLNSCSGCEYSEVVEADVKNVTMTETNPTCVKSGSRVYTMIKDGQELAVTETLPKIGHKINGVSVDELKNSDGYLVYNGESISAFEGEEIVCGKVIQNGLYVCSECSNMYKETVVVDHECSEEWRTLPGNEVTCVKDGFDTLNCKKCDAVLEERVVLKLGHSYTHSLELKVENSTFFVKSTCNNGCGLVVVEENVDVRESKREVATCGSPEKVYYCYEKDGVALEFVKTMGTPISKNHTFGLNSTSGVYDYVHGVTIPATAGIAEKIVCGKVSESFYAFCKVCGCAELIKVNVPNHEYELDGIINEPSFSTNGLVVISCKHTDWECDHNKTVKIDRMKLGVNVELVSSESGEDKDTYLYSTEVEGVKIEFKISLPKNFVP